MNRRNDSSNASVIQREPRRWFKPMPLILAALPLCASMYSPAQVLTAWVARYNGPPVLGTGDAYAKKVAVDGAGNVYVSGNSYDSRWVVATVKYDSNGKQLWETREAMAGVADMTVDGAGNVYETGEGTNSDYGTVKYDANGNQIWYARYAETGNNGSASAVAVDSIGNVFVTGYKGDGWQYDYVTIKYDPNGNQLWVARYNGPGIPANGADQPVALKVDDAGNVYVTGKSFGSGTGWDYATVKYDINGNELWVARYNGSSWDQAAALAVDKVGNVYVTGYSTGWNYDYATVKYDSNGNQLWVARYNGPQSGWDQATALTVDPAGNVYVTGYSGFGDSGFGTATSDYATVKYDSSGNQLWVARYSAPGLTNNSALGVVVDGVGNVYVIGDTAMVKYDSNGSQLWAASGDWSSLTLDRGGNVCVTGQRVRTLSPGPPVPRTVQDYMTAKYDPSGKRLWVGYYNAPGNGDDHAEAIAVDQVGNVYVTGYSADDPSGNVYEWSTVKYDTKGNQLWVARDFPSGGQYAPSEPHALAVDSMGNVVVTGIWIQNCMTVKYDSNGNRLWSALYDGPQRGVDGGGAIKVDGAGNVYIAAESYAPGLVNSDYVTVKYDAGGRQLWATRYNGPANDEDFPSALVVDVKGNVYVTGQSIGSGTFYDYATVKYDPNGNQLWVARYASPGNVADAATALAVDSAGNVYVTGSAGNGNATIKYDTNGRQLWMVNTNLGYSERARLALDGAGNVYVSFGTTISKYDRNGNQIWATAASAEAMAVDAAGNVFVTDWSYNSASDIDYLTAKYDTNGRQVWAIRYDGPSHATDWPAALGVDNAGNAYVTGSSMAPAASSQTAYDYATIKYVSAPAIVPGNQTAEVGSTVCFSVPELSAQPLTYAWFFNLTNFVCFSTNGSLRLLDAQTSQSGAYTVGVTNASGAVTSSPAILSVVAVVPRRTVPALTLQGITGTILNLDSRKTLDSSAKWATFDTVPLASASQWYFDRISPLPAGRLYRAWDSNPLDPPSRLDLHMVPAISLTGNIGDTLRVDYINAIGPTDAWWTLDTVTLTNTSQLYFDTSSIGQPARLYRLVPVL